MSTEAYDNIPLPSDWNVQAEWAQARLMYPHHPDARFAPRLLPRPLDWREGGTSWTQDYPRADRHFAVALRRLTRITCARVEQPSTLTISTIFTTGPGCRRRDGRLAADRRAGQNRSANICSAAASFTWTISGDGRVCPLR